MLDLVNCKILSTINHADVDAYLLSESSMFVFPHKLVLKTCGTTTLLYGIPRILEIAALEAGFPHVSANTSKGTPAAATPFRIFYSRKNFQFPDKQHGPHRSWQSEVNYLDELFPNGSAYMIGKMNGEHWYLYFTAPDTKLTPPLTPEAYKVEDFRVDSPDLESCLNKQRNDVTETTATEQDYTLEILMTDLDEKKANQFWLKETLTIANNYYSSIHRDSSESTCIPVKLKSCCNGKDSERCASTNCDAVCYDELNNKVSIQNTTSEGHSLGTIISATSGLAEIYPRNKYPLAQIDAYVFDPCGFSANGVVPATDERGSLISTHYFTVHVTPEPHCSYASFETNVPADQCDGDTSEIVKQIINIFKPGRFSVTLFEAKTTSDGIHQHEGAKAKRDDNMENMIGYRRVERIFHDLNGYDLVFRYFERLDWKGGAPRLGEHTM